MHFKKALLVLDGAGECRYNMAMDEALAESVKDLPAPTILRIYSWTNASLSLGYFEKMDVVERLFQARTKKIPMVRRITGGGTVLHGNDLTFSVIARMPHPDIPTNVKDSYLRINEAVRLGIQVLCPDVDYADCRTAAPLGGRQGRICFESPSCYDLLRNGKKILGASQRRLGDVLLHQSSIFMEADAAKLRSAVIAGFQKQWNVEFELFQPSAPIVRRVSEIIDQRYSDPQWMRVFE